MTRRLICPLVRPVSRSILIETGDFRKTAKEMDRVIMLADAVHIGTAIEAHRRYFFTSDKRFIVPTFMTTVAPDELGCVLIKQVLGA